MDVVKVALAALSLILEEAPDLVDAWYDGDKDKIEAWLRARQNALEARLRFEEARKE